MRKVIAIEGSVQTNKQHFITKGAIIPGEDPLPIVYGSVTDFPIGWAHDYQVAENGEVSLDLDINEGQYEYVLDEKQFLIGYYLTNVESTYEEEEDLIKITSGYLKAVSIYPKPVWRVGMGQGVVIQDFENL